MLEKSSRQRCSGPSHVVFPGSKRQILINRDSAVLFQSCILLERQNLISTATSRYGSTTIRLQHQFAPLQSLQYPSPISHEEYLENDEFHDGSTQFVRDSINYCFEMAHELGQQLLKLPQPSFQLLSDLGRDQVQKLIQVCIGNSTALHRSTSAKGSKNGPNATGRPASCRAKGCESIFDFGVHTV